MDLYASKPAHGPRIIVSYARADRDQLAALLARLQAEQLDVGFDHRLLDADDAWWPQLRDYIAAAQHLVLLLSPAALASRYVRAEWGHARREGTLVSPVRLGSGLDLAGLPLWMRDAHHYTLGQPDSENQLIARLKGEPRRWRASNMVPGDAAQRFEPRPALTDWLLTCLRTPIGDPTAASLALWGPGGVGKTALAGHLGRSPEIIEAFYDSVIWIAFHGRPAPDRKVLLAGLVRTLTGRDISFQSPEEAETAWRDLIDDRRCLLILEDVARAADLGPFLPIAARPDRAARLITTRNRALVPPGWTMREVGPMEPQEGLALLAQDLDRPAVAANRAALHHLAEQPLGRIPFLLAQANAVLRKRTRNGQTLAHAIAAYQADLAARGAPAALSPDERNDPKRSLRGTIALSLAELPDEPARDRCRDLAIFRRQATITVQSAAWLWGVNRATAEDHCADLRDLALLAGLDLDTGTFRLHDHMHDVLREEAAPRATALHTAYVEAIFAACAADWRRLDDAYALRALPWHATQASRADRRADLLLDPGWMMAKIAALGVEALLEDYDV